MKKTISSLGHSLEGLAHALKTEVNLRRFVIGHCILLALGIWLGIDMVSLFVITIFAGVFLAIELLNTAIERLADTLDDCEKTRNGGHYHLGIKQTKDTAAAGSLIALIVYGGVLAIILPPYILFRFLNLT